MKTQKMRRSVLGFLALSLAISSSPAFASFTRISGLGVNTWNVEDDVNFWLNPAYLAWSKNMMVGELGTAAVPGVLTGVPNSGAIGAGTQWGTCIYDLGFGPIAFSHRRPYGLGGILRSELIGGTGYNAAMIANADATFPGGFNPVAAAGTTYASLLGVAGAPVSSALVLPLSGNNNHLDLTWGYSLASNLAIGALLSWTTDYSNPTYSFTTATAAATDGTIETKRNSSNIHVGGGVTIGDLVPDLLSKLELSVVLGMPTFDVTQTERSGLTAAPTKVDDTVKSKGNALALFARGTTKINNMTKLLTTFWMRSGDVSSDIVAKHDTDGDGLTTDNVDRDGVLTDKVSTWMLDSAVNYWANKDLLLVMGLGFGGNTIDQGYKYNSNITGATGTTQDDSLKTETSTILAFGGLEHKTFDWITTRIGGQRNLVNTSKTTVTDKDYAVTPGTESSNNKTVANAYADSATVLNMGATFNLGGGLMIDAFARQQVLFSGPHFISGVPNSLFSQLTAIYKF